MQRKLYTIHANFLKLAPTCSLFTQMKNTAESFSVTWTTFRGDFNQMEIFRRKSYMYYNVTIPHFRHLPHMI